MPPLGARPSIRARRRVTAAAALGAALALGAGLAIGGCGGAADIRAHRALTAYSGPPAALFDDAIEPAAVGLDLDKSYAPRADKTLRERAQTADAVIRVRVSTVTAKKDGPEATYQLGLRTVEKLAGQTPPPADFTIQIDRASDAHGIMKSFESRLVGYSFVAFVREFAHPSGDSELHFHLAPDTKEVTAAVEEALLLERLK